MARLKFKHPLSGNPRTVQSKNRDGTPTFSITPRELTPGGAKLADTICALTGAILALENVVVAMNSHTGTAAILQSIITSFALYCAIAWSVRLALRRETSIRMTPEAISVRHWQGWQHYARDLEHRFALQVHDNAKHEQQQHEYEIKRASARGRIVRRTAYYGESFHIILVHAGHRQDLLTVYGQKEATAIIARLQYCDRCLDEAMSMGGGIKQRPEDEWNDTPGGLGNA
ncbi:hypothetical protein ABH944_005436 [Caballeronia udeis]|uniref:Uncharacterized protein n=1 Tax=Caballeronia udeis TaxID=1232866 RepID=A0ABW8MNG8_9BURK